ncbi:MAG TPA: alpha/beta hydrolase [Candidatus Paceibacterota bacterium]|nr:alpha/beta hydrolase [Candidatus Paceibacterota bacterium]
MKQQVFAIHGGNAFDTYEEYIADLKQQEVTIERTRSLDWKGNLQKVLGDSFEVILPRMPNSQNARYAEWKIWFEKFVPQFEEDVIFIGHSLGGIFLAKYLSEEKYPKRIKATLLVAAPYNAPDDHPYVDFNILTDLTGLQEQGGKIILYQSEDDQLVPFSNFERYRRELPGVTTRVFTDRQHFNASEFPEIVSDIQNL